MHTDLCGPISPEGLNGEKYMQLLTDDFSGAIWVSNLKTKAEAARGTKDMVLHAQKISGEKVITIRPDGAKEFKEGDCKACLDSNGTLLDDIPPYSSESNGRAERANRTVMEKARTILSELNMVCSFEDYKKLWPEAVRCVVYVYNRTLTRATHKDVRDKTPYEIVTGNKPDLSNLRIFGTKVKVLKPKAYRKSKVDSKTWDGLDVGYNPGDAYRVYIPELGHVLISKDVTFIEKLYRYDSSVSVGEIGMNDDRDNEEDCQEVDNNEGRKRLPWIPESDASDDDQFEDATDVTDQDSNDALENPVTRSGRTVVPPKGLDSRTWRLSQQKLNVEMLTRKFQRVLKKLCDAKDKSKWISAMTDEIVSLSENDVFIVSQAPEGRKVVKCRWVFALKTNSKGEVYRHKARLVAKGYSQVKGIDYKEVFSPVVRFDTLRFLLAQVASLDLELYQVDVKTAFLNGKLDEDVWIELLSLPKPLMQSILSSVKEGKGGRGSEMLMQLCSKKVQGSTHYVLKLLKSLYGLKQASLKWHERLKEVLTMCGFEQSASDPCLFVVKMKNGRKFFLLVYVDDIIIAGNTKKDCQSVVRKLQEQLELSTMEEAHFFLGINIERDRKLKTLYISQSAYIDKILKRFRLEGSSSNVPMRCDVHLSECEAEDRNSKKYPFRELIGCLMYLACVTRPDIMFAVQKLARYFTTYGRDHWNAAQVLGKYISSTKSLVLRYGSGDNKIVGFTDSDWAGDHEKRKSTGGFVFTINGNAFIWNSKRQSVVAVSSVEAEYIAQARCVREALWVRTLIKDFTGKVSTIDIYADNKGAISLANSNKSSAPTKHIDVSYHLTRDYCMKGYVDINYVASSQMVADGMTKPLDKQKLITNREMYSLVDIKFVAGGS